MGLFGSLINTAVSVAVTPVAVAADAVKLPGRIVNGRPEESLDHSQEALLNLLRSLQ